MNEPTTRNHNSPRPPVRAIAIAALTLVLAAAALFGATRVFLVAASDGNEDAALQQAAASQVQIGVPQAQQAPKPLPDGRVLVSGTLPATPAPTQIPDVPRVISSGATVAPAEAAPGSNLSAITANTALASPTAQQTSEIGIAYGQFIDVTRDARFKLDPARLTDVAAGNELDSLRHEIDQDRALGRALQVPVEHESVFVLGVQDDQADVAASAASVIYRLQRIDGIWKVVDARTPDKH
jgi:hypothetical protein